jgi:hypothetical protein
MSLPNPFPRIPPCQIGLVVLAALVRTFFPRHGSLPQRKHAIQAQRESVNRRRRLWIPVRQPPSTFRLV